MNKPAGKGRSRDGDGAQIETGLQAARRAGSNTEKAHLLAQAIDLYRGELLPGFFEDWIVGERLRLGETYLWRIAWGLLPLGGVARHLDERAKARSLYEEGLTALRAVGNLWSIGFALDGLAPLAIDEQEYVAARRLYEESLCVWQELRHRGRSAQSLDGLARAAQFQGGGDTAASCYQQALMLFLEMGDARGAAECRERLAELTGKPRMP